MDKKIRKIFMTASLLCFTMLAGCANSGSNPSTASGSDTSPDSNALNSADSHSMVSDRDTSSGTGLQNQESYPPEDGEFQDFIPITSEITELESGLSVVRLEGNYGLDDFLNQGGAKSDSDVMKFLTRSLMGSGQNLSFETGAFGCSTISAAHSQGGYLFGRNFDWNTCEAMIVAAYPENGYASFSTVNTDFIRQGAGFASNFLSDELLATAAIYAPLDGMNEKGLCVSVNMIQDGASISQNTDKTDITTTTAIRLLLDKAATTEEAITLLEAYDLHASMNYMVHFAIADNTGKSVAVEYVNDEMIVTDTPILTNFYLAEGEKNGIGTAQSHTRFEILANILKESDIMDKAQVRDALSSVSKGNFGEFESTEWSIVFDQSALTATYYHRENYDKSYSFQIFQRSPL